MMISSWKKGVVWRALKESPVATQSNSLRRSRRDEQLPTDSLLHALPDHLEIHVRTVYRYIDALCASGVPILSESGHDGGFACLHMIKRLPCF